MLKNSENNGTEEIGLVTPTPVVWKALLCQNVTIDIKQQSWFKAYDHRNDYHDYIINPYMVV